MRPDKETDLRKQNVAIVTARFQAIRVKMWVLTYFQPSATCLHSFISDDTDVQSRRDPLAWKCIFKKKEFSTSTFALNSSSWGALYSAFFTTDTPMTGVLYIIYDSYTLCMELASVRTNASTPKLTISFGHDIFQRCTHRELLDTVHDEAEFLTD